MTITISKGQGFFPDFVRVNITYYWESSTFEARADGHKWVHDSEYRAREIDRLRAYGRTVDDAFQAFVRLLEEIRT